MPFNAYAMPVGYNQYQPVISPFNQQAMNYYNPQRPQDECHYVHGIEGANAFQMPPGVNKVTLWDETENQFYVKGYDKNGIPRVLAWNDYGPHVAEPEPVHAQQPQIDLDKYVTKDDLSKLLEKLTIGANGRIVIANEHDA